MIHNFRNTHQILNSEESLMKTNNIRFTGNHEDKFRRSVFQ